MKGWTWTFRWDPGWGSPLILVEAAAAALPAGLFGMVLGDAIQARDWLLIAAAALGVALLLIWGITSAEARPAWRRGGPT